MQVKTFLGSLGLYALALLALLTTLGGMVASRSIGPLLFLVPILALLLPDLRRRILERTKFFPSVGWSAALAFVLIAFQVGIFSRATEENRTKDEATLQQEASARVAAVKKQREEEYAANKAKIIAEVEAQLASGQSREALATITKFMGVTRDPDLGRLQSRAEVQVLKLDLQNEKALSDERLAQIYRTLIKEEPGSRQTYQAKLQKVETQLAAKQKLQEEAARLAALEERYKQQFSSWDGSHRNVESAVKSGMRNPKSYEHVETRYNVSANGLTVYTRYRGTNAFNAIVTNDAVVTVGPDGTVLSLRNQ